MTSQIQRGSPVNQMQTPFDTLLYIVCQAYYYLFCFHTSANCPRKSQLLLFRAKAPPAKRDGRIYYQYIQEFQHGGCSWFKEPFELKFIEFYKENTTFRNIRIEKCTPKILQMCFDLLICTRLSFAF